MKKNAAAAVLLALVNNFVEMHQFFFVFLFTLRVDTSNHLWYQTRKCKVLSAGI